MPARLWENARHILTRPAFAADSVRDGDLSGTVAVGVVAVVGLAEVLARTLSWPWLAFALPLLPVTLLAAWLFAGPSRLELDTEDRLRQVGRLRRREIALGDLTSIEHPGGRRKTALAFWDETVGVVIELRDHSFRTASFRQELGERVRALDATGITIDKRAAELLHLSGP